MVTPPPVDVGARVKQLRDRLKMTQEHVAEGSIVAGEQTLERVEVSKIENGRNRASTARTQAGLAAAFGLPPDVLAAYLAGEMTVDDALARRRVGGGYSRAGNLEAALAYHQHDARWCPPTIAAARAIAVAKEVDPMPQEWVNILDRIESALVATGLLNGSRP